MRYDRITRVNELLRREIGETLFQIMNESDSQFDMAAVTITHVVTSRNLRHARVLVSIREHQAERKQMLGLLYRHRAEIQARISRNVVLKYTPRLSFELDSSVEHGHHMLEILSELEKESEDRPQQWPEESDEQ